MASTFFRFRFLVFVLFLMEATSTAKLALENGRPWSAGDFNRAQPIHEEQLFEMSAMATPTVSSSIEPLIPEPTANPTIGRSANPTVHRSAVPTEMPSAVPTDTSAPVISPTPAPTFIPTCMPTASPTTAPSNDPTIIPTVPPTMVPTLSPTIFPTVPPTCSPTLVPTPPPTVTITQVPTAFPTVAPSSNETAYLLVSFTSNVTLAGLSVATVDSASQTSIIATNAAAMRIAISDITYLDSFAVSASTTTIIKNVLRTKSRTGKSKPTQGTYSVIAVTLTQVAMSSTVYPTPELLYQGLTQALSAAVQDGYYDATLADFVALYGATDMIGAVATSVTSSPEIVSSLTTSPIQQPTSAPDDSDQHIILEVISTLPGIFMIITGVFVIHFRRARDGRLNELKAVTTEYRDLVIKGVIVALAVNLLLTSSLSTGDFTFMLLLVSRLMIISLCALFLLFFIFPAKNELNQSQGISLLICLDALRDNGAVTMYSVIIIMSLFDISMLRYLPWLRTPFTKIMEGYPNMLLIRSSLYGTFFSSVIQSAALIPSLIAHSASSDLNTNVKSVALLVFSVLNMIRSFLSIILHMKKASSVKFKLAIVSEGDVAALADFVGSVDGQSRKLELKDIRSAAEGPLTAGEVSEMLSVARSTKSANSQSEDKPSKPAVTQKAPNKPTPATQQNPMHWDSESLFSLQDDNLSEMTDEVDDRGILFATKINYADETVDILRDQVRLAGLTPLEFIPLPALKAELERLFDCANNALPYDLERLDYLLLCLDHNPQYKAEQEAAMMAWRAKIAPFLEESLDEMRAFVPPNIFKCSESSLVREEGYAKPLAKRLMTKKCLWLVRISSRDIDRMHIAELQGRFNPEAQGLDLTETAAIYASLPEQFSRDADRKKARWRASVEQSLKSMYAQNLANSLPGPKKRNTAYKGQVPSYDGRHTLHEMGTTAQSNVFGPRTSFMHLSLKPPSNAVPGMANPVPTSISGNLRSVSEHDLESQRTESTASSLASSPKVGSFVQHMGASLTKGLFRKPLPKTSSASNAEIQEMTANRSVHTMLPSQTNIAQSVSQIDKSAVGPLPNASAMFGSELSKALGARGANPAAKQAQDRDNDVL